MFIANKQAVTRLAYCQYLVSSQINYTPTNFADHRTLSWRMAGVEVRLLLEASGKGRHFVCERADLKV